MYQTNGHPSLKGVSSKAKPLCISRSGHSLKGSHARITVLNTNWLPEKKPLTETWTALPLRCIRQFRKIVFIILISRLSTTKALQVILSEFDDQEMSLNNPVSFSRIVECTFMLFNQLTSMMYFSVYISGLQKHSECNTVMVMVVSVA